MRFAQRLLTFAAVTFAAIVSGRVVAQADAGARAAESPEEVTVRGRRTLPQIRLELERARDDMFRIFNEANAGGDNDVRCTAEQPTGTRMKHTVCRTAAEIEASSKAAREMLNSLVYSTNGRVNTAGSQATPLPPPPNISSVAAQIAGGLASKDALAQFEDEWKRVFGDNRDLFRAVTHYAEINAEYALARGDTPADADQQVTVLLEEAPVPTTTGPQCEASTLTEFQQRNNVARVSGTVSISMCPAGTTGSFTLVARVRDDTGTIVPIEFNETWQRADDADHVFNADYPIGDNVELMSVRVRGLTCTCAAPAQ